MKAVEFIQKFGWVEAKSVLLNRPFANCARYRPLDNRYSSTFSTGNTVSTSELKKYTDAYDLVEFCGGPDVAKLLDPNFVDQDTYADLQKAITLVEEVESLKEVG